MPLLPPELAQGFRDETERVAARHLLVERARKLGTIEELAQKTPDRWSPAELQAIPNAMGNVPYPAPERVARWADIFAEELAEIRRLAAIVRQLSDPELRETLYLSGRLLASVTDRPIAEVDRLPI